MIYYLLIVIDAVKSLPEGIRPSGELTPTTDEKTSLFEDAASRRAPGIAAEPRPGAAKGPRAGGSMPVKAWPPYGPGG